MHHLFLSPQRKTSVPQTAVQSAVEEAFSFDGPPDAMITVAGKTYLYFCGSGYLGLQSHPEVLSATCEAVLRYGVGTATTRTAFTSPPVFEVERRTAEIFGTENALYTSSGYAANQLLLESLEKTFDRIFIDEAAHYSLFDAAKRIRRKRGEPLVFQHCSTAGLQMQLEKNLQFNERPMVLTDGVFAHHAHIAPLNEYAELLSHYNGASLFVDDAQGFGILGAAGRGTYEHFGIDTVLVNNPQSGAGDYPVSGETEYSGCRLYLSLSLSKAAGGGGGAVPGSADFIQQLKDRSSAYFASSAPPAPIAAATAKALSVLTEDNLRRQLRENAEYLHSRLKNGIGSAAEDPAGSILPIFTFSVGSAANMKRIQKELSAKSILIAYLPRNVSLGSEGALRIAVFATHTRQMLGELADALKIACER